jgi:predicted Zn-ribbon and HTH transcriptional regulator
MTIDTFNSTKPAQRKERRKYKRTTRNFNATCDSCGTEYKALTRKEVLCPKCKEERRLYREMEQCSKFY